jgi:hypothetical protein
MNDYAQNIIDIKYLINDIYNDLCSKKDVRNDVYTLLGLAVELKSKVDTIGLGK